MPEDDPTPTSPLPEPGKRFPSDSAPAPGGSSSGEVPSEPEATIDRPASPTRTQATIGTAVGTTALGKSVGPYKLLAVLGEGGFGVVYLAARREPHVQRVALKVIKPGMDSTAVVNRFAAERQALAVMDHPSIARVFDGGTTSDGRPYFVMEFVKGDSITKFCDRERLDIDERLELFITVCEAVQHAHGKGVIHRDLKPSNVLVEFEDGRATPKIIDFGVAKALNQRLTEGTVYTEVGQFIGTPEYMSPEQAEMSGVDIDTRADVYSLGVMLYELIAGTLPFDGEKLREGGFLGIQKTIREVEPPKPSQRFTTIVAAGGDAARNVASARRLEPGSLSKRLKADLDWVIMRCLEKDRVRRYQTANDLALELRRVLNDEPVLAGPPSFAYRTSKFVRRHRTGVFAAAAVLVALIAATAISIVFAVREAAAKGQAQEERDRAREAERLADAEAERARIAAATSDRISDFTSGILKSIDPDVAGDLDKTLVRRILDDASRRVEDELAEDPQVEAAIRDTIGGTYVALGELDDAQPQLDRALALRLELLGEDDPRTLDTRDKLAELVRRSGDVETAVIQQRAILESRLRLLGEDDPDTIMSMANLGLALLLNDEADAARDQFEECLARSRKVLGDDDKRTFNAMNNLAAVLRRDGRLDDAEALYREALAGQRRVLGIEHSETLASQGNLGVLLRERRNFDESELLLREVVEVGSRVLGPQHPETLVAINNLGMVQFSTGDLEAAIETFRMALASYRRSFPASHPEVVKMVSNIVSSLRRLDRYDEAIAELRALRLDMAEEGGGGVEGVKAGYLLATVLEQQGRLEEAEQLFGRLVFEARRTPRGEFLEAAVLIGHGKCLRTMKRFPNSETTLLEAYQMLVASRGPDTANARTVAGELASLYAAWDEAEPGAGHDLSREEWAAKASDGG
jgi:serine/threonine protein kinase/Tfp pilus assembly protein PilF